MSAALTMVDRTFGISFWTILFVVSLASWSLFQSPLPTKSVQFQTGAADVTLELHGPGRAPQLLDNKTLNELLSAPSPLRGFQKKQGMLNPREWLPEFKQDRKMKKQEWMEMAGNGTVAALDQLPRESTGCQVFVNHDYRFFWIKTRKTGGTSMRAGLAWICGDKWHVPENANFTFCSDAPWKKDVPESGSPEKWWEEYFVFTTVRNPYVRFASAQTYMQKRCAKQSLGEGCRDPFRIAEGSSGGVDCGSSLFFLQHIREHTSCLFTKEGGLAVDFIAQTENMAEDFVVIAREINKRRRVGVPPLAVVPPAAANVNRKVSNSYLKEFQKYPECIPNLDIHLANEFRDLLYLT